MTKHVRVPRHWVPLAVIVTAVGSVTAGAAVAETSTGTPVAAAVIHVLATGNGTGRGGKVLVTGGIGDHGTSASVNKAGKPDSNGSYEKLSLTQGAIVLNKTKLDDNIDHAYGSLVVNSATCSTSVSASGPLTAVDGTGAYQGISGTVHVTVIVGFVLPRYPSGAHKGNCNESNSSQPTASLQVVYGGGTVGLS